ncbi:hypothetical protein DAI22_08g080200 [Oryza sativa Japonica Group]|nr:hypothetical protein DAI22_08g080200 [Oryza sativa Japonica Group]
MSYGLFFFRIPCLDEFGSVSEACHGDYTGDPHPPGASTARPQPAARRRSRNWGSGGVGGGGSDKGWWGEVGKSGRRRAVRWRGETGEGVTWQWRAGSRWRHSERGWPRRAEQWRRSRAPAATGEPATRSGACAVTAMVVGKVSAGSSFWAPRRRELGERMLQRMEHRCVVGWLLRRRYRVDGGDAAAELVLTDRVEGPKDWTWWWMR